jgi:5-hydroxyisourate hydrolase-like protein (transthyretin family)
MNKIFLIMLILATCGLVFGFSLFGKSHELELTIPIEGMMGRFGKCQVDVLDLDDTVIGSAYRYAYITKDYYSLKIKVKIKQEVDDYDLLRVKVTFKKQERIYSLYQLQDRMIVKILGQDEFIKGTPINYRVIVQNQRTNEPMHNVQVTITLKTDAKQSVVFTESTDRSGTCNTDFIVPDGIDRADLHFEILSDIGKDTYDANIKLLSGNLTYLVTDKPIYQPGQTIHMRTLTLCKPDLVSVSGKAVTFEVEDSKGNKVFKRVIKTDDFGTGYTQFVLADEVNFGTYTIRTILDGEKVEKTVTVEKYVLPKFNIVLKTDREFYMPGDKMEGDIDVQYFFGKPVAAGKVTITTYRYDIGFQKEAVIEGKTDINGNYHFTYRLPDYFVGEPLEKGDAFIRFDIEVIDKANHSQKVSLKKKIVQDVLSISIVPEGGILKADLENRIFVLVNYPDGTPCVASVEMYVKDKKMTSETDGYGIAEFLYTPQDARTEILVKAHDERGETAQMKKEFSLEIDRDQIIMRIPRGIFKAGESVDMQFLTTKKTGRVYLDVIKNNQTVLTKSVDISHGLGRYTLNLTPDIAGSIWFHAYIVTPGGTIVRDTRFCYVHAANDLLIDVKPDQEEYLPGQDGRILFTVKDQNGKPKVAALCIAIVDEAVFAVSELQPGLEKVYFTLEKEILQPRYEIHGFEPQHIVRKQGIEPRAENVMFSTLTPKEPFPVHYTTPLDVNVNIIRAFYQRLVQTRDTIYDAINKYYAKYKKYPKSNNGIEVLIDEGFLHERDVVDPWARKYRIIPGDEYLSWFNIVSAGPDGVFNNADDINEWGWGWDEEGVVFQAQADMMLPRAVAGAPVAGGEFPMKSMASREEVKKDGGKKPGEEPRIREFFPETFVFEPALITNHKGEAWLSVTMPDAITTWRVTTFASSHKGELGSTLAQIRVFQDFFVDIDLPIALTEGDEISIPIAMYNYLSRDQEITIVLQEEEWFDILEKAEVTKTLKKDEVSVVYFPIKVTKIGYYSILVKAYGEVKSDAIKRMIAVLPNGRQFENIMSDRLEGTITQKVHFPHNAISHANTVILKIFPGIYSQIVEGLDNLFRVPFGCFEQTTSVTYPNILLLDYLRQTEQIKPETEMTAEEYISLGYQRLLSFEVQGGGFSWFGDAPANKVLTAYGLMQFNDMAKVYEIDERIIDRTVQWLKSQQNKDGSWSPDAQYLHAESWTRIQKSEILPTAYICWALGDIGERGTAVSRGLSFLKSNVKAVDDSYIMALVANAFVAVEPKSETTLEVLKKLVSMAQEKDDVIYWESDIASVTFSRGAGADIEATGLAAYALIKSGKYSDVVSKVLTYLIRAKQASGLWYTTQGTVIALRSLVASLGGELEDIDANIAVTMNGKKVTALNITKANADIMHQIDLTEYLGKENTVEISVNGEGNFTYEITSAYYIPWKDLPRPVQPPFTIDVDYDRTKLIVNDIVNVDVSIRLNRSGTAQMVMVDLGIPPGFEVQTPTLDELVGKKIQKYTVTPRQLIIYLDEVSSTKPVTLTYGIKAKYPIKAQIRSSRVYEYYNTSDEGVEQPIEMSVTL